MASAGDTAASGGQPDVGGLLRESFDKAAGSSSNVKSARGNLVRVTGFDASALALVPPLPLDDAVESMFPWFTMLVDGETVEVALNPAPDAARKTQMSLRLPGVPECGAMLNLHSGLDQFDGAEQLDRNRKDIYEAIAGLRREVATFLFRRSAQAVRR